MGKTRRLVIGSSFKAELENLSKHSSSPKIRQRCEIVLLNESGLTNVAIQKQLGCSSTTITSTLDRYEYNYPFQGLKCLSNLKGGGRKAALQACDKVLVMSAVQTERQRLSLAKAIIEEKKGQSLSDYQVKRFLKSLVGSTTE
jgi:transposase